ncbi:MAG: hypothetical protein RIC85_04025 [Gammaproteobacteria bacterium]
MSDDDDFSEDELGDLEEVFGDEVPVWGTAKRLYRYLKKKLSKEYREQIRLLRQNEKILIRNIDQQNQTIADLRKYISSLENRIEELEGNLINLQKTEDIDKPEDKSP